MKAIATTATTRFGRLASRRLTWLLAGISIVAAMLVLALARQFSHGVGLGGDWASYLGAARNLLAGNGFVSYNGGPPYVYWPPLYPLLLATGACGGFFNVFDVAGPLNAVSVGLAVFIVGQALRRHVATAWVILGCAALAVAPMIVDIAAKAMSEAVFMLCVIAALAVACRYLEAIGEDSQGGTPHLLLGLGAAAVAALAALTRYIGVCVALVVAPLVFFAGNAPLAARIWRTFFYVAVALGPVGLWLLWAGTRVEERFAGQDFVFHDFTFAEVLGGYLAEIANWVLLGTLERWRWRTSWRGVFPVSLHEIEGWMLVAGVTFIGVIGVCLLMLALSVAAAGVRWWRRADLQPTKLAYCVFGGFSVVYLVGIVATQTVMGFAPVGWRYALPAFPPLLVAAVLAGAMLRRRCRRWHVSALARVGAPLLLLWVCSGATVSGKRIWAASERITPDWKNSETLAYIRRELGHQRFHTNNHRAVFAHTSHDNHGTLELRLELAKRQIQSLPEGAYIVVMRSYRPRYKYSAAELRELDSLAPVAELRDGVVFRVTRTGHRNSSTRSRTTAVSTTP